MREIAERAHDLDGAVVREAVEHGFELTPRAGVALASERNRDLADPLDGSENGFALLLADGVAQDPANQSHILPQCSVAIRQFQHVHAPSSGRTPSASHGDWLARSAPDQERLVPSFWALARQYRAGRIHWPARPTTHPPACRSSAPRAMFRNPPINRRRGGGLPP